MVTSMYTQIILVHMLEEKAMAAMLKQVLVFCRYT